MGQYEPPCYSSLASCVECLIRRPENIGCKMFCLALILYNWLMWETDEMFHVSDQDLVYLRKNWAVNSSDLLIVLGSVVQLLYLSTACCHNSEMMWMKLQTFAPLGSTFI